MHVVWGTVACVYVGEIVMGYHNISLGVPVQKASTHHGEESLLWIPRVVCEYCIENYFVKMIRKFVHLKKYFM